MLARSWAGRDKLELRLPPDHLALEPGSKLDLPLSPERWTIAKCIIDGLVVVAELHPGWTVSPTIAADSGRVLASSDIVAAEATLALLDIPNVLGEEVSEPTVLLAATAPSAGWKARPVTLTYGGTSVAAQTARRKAVLGHALNVLPSGDPWLIDSQSSVEVEVVDADQWLTSCDDDALAGGSNLALLGSELIQFGTVTPLGAGRFRLERLLRGRGGTEWMSGNHSAGEVFVLIKPDALQSIRVPSWATGASISAASGSSATELILSGESLRGPSPIQLEAEWLPTGDLQLSWTRRSRHGWAWIDEVDAPLGEAREDYRVTVIGSSAAIEFEVPQPQMTVAASSLANAGAGPATIEVRQIGDLAASRPAQLSLTLP
jgi:hypothetical protein